MDIKTKKIPTLPGCYLYKDFKENIIYVGKAKNLKKRVLSYFSKDHPDIKTQNLVKEINDVDFFVTKNEIEALLLESNLIKKYRPKYNIDLKDSKRYAYILLTDEKYPRLLTARTTSNMGKYYGPFTSGYYRQTLITQLQKIFFIRTCKTLPKRACLRYHLNLCKAPCINNQSEVDYNDNVEKAIKYLKGDSKELYKQIEKEMKEFSKDQKYELAKIRKEQLDALNHLHEKQIVEEQREYDEDIINYIILGQDVKIMVFNVRGGILKDKEDFTVSNSENFLEEFIKAYYIEGGIPQKIFIPKTLDDKYIGDYFSDKAKRKIELIVPKIGSRKSLMDLAKKNLEVNMTDIDLIQQDFEQKLKLSGVNIIDCFDISHLSGTHTVASMVRFVNNKPSKKDYRRFKIETVDGVDDFRSMAEVIGRRMKRLKEDKIDMPDLIVIDGGREQLKFAHQSMINQGLNIPMIGLAKKFEEIYVPHRKEPFNFDNKLPMMKLLIALRDETHRFAITYNRLLRTKSLKN